MPFRRSQPPPDLARVARILGDEPERGGWVPAPPRSPPVSSSARAVAPTPSALDELDADLRRARRPGVVTTPEPLQLGRWSVSTSTVVALIALVVAVGCVFAVRVLWAERSTGSGEPTPVAASVPYVSGPTFGAAAVSAGVPSVPDPASRGTPAPRPLAVEAEIVVHVVGQVAGPVSCGCGRALAWPTRWPPPVVHGPGPMSRPSTSPVPSSTASSCTCRSAERS